MPSRGNKRLERRRERSSLAMRKVASGQENQRKKPDTTNSTDILSSPSMAANTERRQATGSVRSHCPRKTSRERTIASGDGPRVNDDPDVQGGMR
jgi:hypothetical protein